MEQIYQDIPRFYTALSEWGVCTIYCLLLEKRKEGRVFLIYELLCPWERSDGTGCSDFSFVCSLWSSIFNCLESGEKSDSGAVSA